MKERGEVSELNEYPDRLIIRQTWHRHLRKGNKMTRFSNNDEARLPNAGSRDQ